MDWFKILSCQAWMRAAWSRDPVRHDKFNSCPSSRRLHVGGMMECFSWRCTVAHLEARWNPLDSETALHNRLLQSCDKAHCSPYVRCCTLHRIKEQSTN